MVPRGQAYHDAMIECDGMITFGMDEIEGWATGQLVKSLSGRPVFAVG